MNLTLLPQGVSRPRAEGGPPAEQDCEVFTGLMCDGGAIPSHTMAGRNPSDWARACPMPGCGHVLGVLSCPCGPGGQLISQPSGPDTPADLIWGGSSEARGGKRDALPTPIFPEACGDDLPVPGSARLPLARPHPLSRTSAIDPPSHRRGTVMEMASWLLHGSIYPKIAGSPHCAGIFQQRCLHRYLLYGYIHPQESARSPGRLFVS